MEREVVCANQKTLKEIHMELDAQVRCIFCLSTLSEFWLCSNNHKKNISGHWHVTYVTCITHSWVRWTFPIFYLKIRTQRTLLTQPMCNITLPLTFVLGAKVGIIPGLIRCSLRFSLQEKTLACWSPALATLLTRTVNQPKRTLCAIVKRDSNPFRHHKINCAKVNWLTISVTVVRTQNMVYWRMRSNKLLWR